MKRKNYFKQDLFTFKKALHDASGGNIWKLDSPVFGSEICMSPTAPISKAVGLGYFFPQDAFQVPAH